MPKTVFFVCAPDLEQCRSGAPPDLITLPLHVAILTRSSLVRLTRPVQWALDPATSAATSASRWI
jgi:hypothetical protein